MVFISRVQVACPVSCVFFQLKCGLACFVHSNRGLFHLKRGVYTWRTGCLTCFAWFLDLAYRLPLCDVRSHPNFWDLSELEQAKALREAEIFHLKLWSFGWELAFFNRKLDFSLESCIFSLKAWISHVKTLIPHLKLWSFIFHLSFQTCGMNSGCA